MNNQILEYFAETRSGYIHARGKLSTSAFVQLLDCAPKEDVLEIGFGTGTTLVEMASVYPQTNFHGIDASSAMFEAADKRIQFCGLSERVQLQHHNEEVLPFENDTFDRIYVESVLAIQEGDALPKMLQEIKRILKPQGVLLFNETIWLDATETNTIQEINKACKQSFGIIQANAVYPHVSDWKNLLYEIGFQIELSTFVSDLTEKSVPNSKNIHRSRMYTLTGRLKSRFNSRLRKQWKAFQMEMKKITGGKGQLMEGVIIKVKNLE